MWAAVSGLQVGVLSDTHIKEAYDSMVPAKKFCNPENYKGEANPKNAEEDAPFGRYYCDPPAKLIETMFEHYKKTWGNPDIILFTGDHVAHYISYNKKMKKPMYDELKSALRI
jgi:hypothetical protein